MYFLFVIPDDDIQYVAKKTTLRLLNNIVFQCITFMICLDSHLSKIQKIKQATGIYEKREVFLRNETNGFTYTETNRTILYTKQEEHVY